MHTKQLTKLLRTARIFIASGSRRRVYSRRPPKEEFMSSISTGRVILGGIVAGIVSDILGYLVDGVWLAPRWAEGMKALGHVNFAANQWIGFNLLGIAGGIVAIWVYAAIRPRFGPGVGTAIKAGAAVWFLGTLLPNSAFMYLAGLFPRHLTLYTTIGAFFEVVIGTIIGAMLYKEATGATEANLSAVAQKAGA
jgi:hypothetical protein